MVSWVSWRSRLLGEAVGDHAGVRREEEHRQELQAGGDAQGGAAAVGEAEDQPVLGDALHPGAGVGHQAAERVAPVVGVVEGSEGGAQELLSVGRAWSCVVVGQSAEASRSSSGAARRRVSRSLGVRSRSRRASQASRRARSARSVVRPCSESDDHDLTAVCLVGSPADEAALIEGVDDAGHARRLDPLVAGQLADGGVAVAEQAAEDGHRAHAQGVVGMSLVAEAPAQSHDAQPQLARQTRIAARGHLHRRHVVSITHYLR